jgi:hypothetical protein
MVSPPQVQLPAGDYCVPVCRIDLATAMGSHHQLMMPGTALFIAAIFILICGAVAQAEAAEHVLLAAYKGHAHATVIFPLRGC